MISLPVSPETEQMLLKLSESEKKTLALMVNAFVARPKRSMSQVMESMAEYAKKQGLDMNKLDELLNEE
jgi:hypothetical protein